jgi:hypothetical protein
VVSNRFTVTSNLCNMPCTRSSDKGGASDVLVAVVAAAAAATAAATAAASASAVLAGNGGAVALLRSIKTLTASTDSWKRHVQGTTPVCPSPR